MFKNAKYIEVDSTEMNKKLYKVSREYSLNDFFNFYTCDEIINVKEIFDKYDIPSEFQKIFIRVNIPFFIKKEAEEVISGFAFDLTGSKIFKKDDEKYIKSFNVPVFEDGTTFRKKLVFETELKYFESIYVIDFYKSLINKGYSELYFLALSEIFDSTLDLTDSIIEHNG